MGIPRNLALAVALAAGGFCALNAAPAQARVNVDIYANVAPPPLRTEVVPGPRHGYVWVPGDWRWGHRRYNWHRGYWVRDRHGRHYAPSRWEQDGNRWRYRSGRWDR
jgi:hypothetical protein